MAHAQSKILPTSTRHHSTVEQSSQDKENAQPRTTSSSHQGRQRDAAAGKANTSPRAGLDDEDLSDTENQDVDDRHRQSTDDDEDESHHRRSRPRRASEKEAQRIEEKEAADARKHEKHAKAAKAAKKKELQASGQNDNDENLAPRRDDVFTSRTVPSRPTATKNLAQRNSRIPPPPQFSEDRRPTQGGAGSGSSRDNVENDCRRHDRSDTGHFRGRSPLPAARSPLRPLVRNINDKVVPQRVQVDLRDDPLPHREHVSSRHRSSSPRGRRLSHDHARSPRARSRSAHPRSRSARSRSRSQHACSHAPCPRSRSPRVPARRATRSCSPQAASPGAGRSPRARSPSPVAGAKRQRSTSVGELRTAQSQRTGTGGRVKASEYDDTTQELLKQAISNFRVLISAENAFPDHDTEVEFVGRAWNGACHTLKLSMELTPNIAKLIANRGSHLRGELKTKIKPLIEITYGFNNGQNKKSIARNRVLAEELKDGCTFAFKDIKERKGMYKNTILQTAVNAMWFANRRDEGAMYPEYFDPFPLQAFGLTLAVIENLIDQYATGIRTETPFTANDYRGVYEAHCKALLEFQEHTEPYPILHGILSRMHNLGRFHSGAQPLSICGVSLLNKSDLDAAIKEFAEDSSTESEGEYGPADEQ